MDARSLLDVLSGERAHFVALTRRRVGAQADAEDIVQRSLAHAARRSASVADPSRVHAWFYRLLRNAIADHHRARARDAVRRDGREVDELASVAPTETTPCRCASRLLDELRASYADVIRRIDVDGENPESVARALGISRGNLDVRLHRARKVLRDDVIAYCGVTSHERCLDCTCDGETRCHSVASSSHAPPHHP